MSKRFRGKGLIDLPGRGKGICPLCGRKSVKLLWDKTGKNGQVMKVCKRCANKR